MFKKIDVNECELIPIERLDNCMNHIDNNLRDETINKEHTRTSGEPITVLTGIDDEEFVTEVLQKAIPDNIAESKVDNNLLTLYKRYIVERERLKKELRAMSLMIARIGGEKYAILAKEASEDSVEIIIKRIIP